MNQPRPSLPDEADLNPSRSLNPQDDEPTDYDAPAQVFEGMTLEPVFDDGREIEIDHADD